MQYTSELMMEVHGDIKRHIDGIKWIAASIMIIVVISVLGIVLIVRTDSQQPMHNEIKLNDTACIYVKQYHLNDDVYLTVCNLNGYITLDIRQFVNSTATIKGIGLTLQQWLILKQITHPIDTAISEARTYWKTLRHMR